MSSQHSDLQEQLRKALRSVAESTQQDSAPQHLEERLVHAFRNRNSLPGRRRPALSIFAAAAVLIVAAAAGLLWKPTSIDPVKPVSLRAPVSADPWQTPPDEPLIFATRRAARPSNTVAENREPADNPGEVEAVAVSDFLPLGYSDTAPGAYQVVRVRMERGSLAQFGLPVNPDRSEEALDADLLVGDDGIPRAVRFVTTVSDRN